MGLFGNVKKAAGGLFGGDFASRAARAGALLEGDYGGAASITHGMFKSKREQEEAEQEQQALAGIRSSLAQEGYPDHVIDGLMSNPKIVADLFAKKYETRQFGPGGGSIGSVDPRTGQTGFRWAPRIDEDGNVFGPGAGEQAPPVLREGVKTIPIVPGGQVVPVSALSGREIGAGGPPIPQTQRGGRLNSWTPEMFDRPGGPPPLPSFAPPQRGPQPGMVEDGYRFKGGNPADPGAWEKVGGAGPAAAPRPFR